MEFLSRQNALASGLLTEDVLARIRERAPGYDRDNTFFHEDFRELADLGYLSARPLSQMVADQRLLARYAPATALGVGMHLTWVGVAQTLKNSGDDSLQWVLDEAQSGEVFAFGVSEAGNDRVLTDSVTTVTKTPDGYAYRGTKIFTSLSPVWTRLSVLGRLGDDIVHGFITRDQEGWSNTPDWNTLGMRATQSYTTTLDGVVVDSARVARRIPVGPNDDAFTVAIFQNFLLLVSAVYAGISDRAVELAIQSAQAKTSSMGDGAVASEDPAIRWQVADAVIALDALGPQLETYASWVQEAKPPHPHWFRLLSGVKHNSVETARRVVDQAMRVAGGSGYRAGHELSRLQRDVLAGVYHPSDTEAVHRTVASDLLGPLP